MEIEYGENNERKNDWDQMTNADAVLGPMQGITSVERIT